MLSIFQNVLDFICDLFATDDYLEGYFGILIALIALCMVFNLFFSFMEKRKNALTLLRCTDYDRYVIVRRRKRARIVLVEKLILGALFWPIFLLVFMIKWVKRSS